jgi:hypothetical protein
MSADKTKIDQENQDSDILVAWSFREYENPERSRRWYIITSLVAIFLLATAVLMSDFLFALIVILMAIILFIVHSKETEDVNFIIAETGIVLAGKFFGYKDFDNFWIVYEPEGAKNVYFKFKSSVRGSLRIPLGETNPLSVREVLLEFLPEDLEKEEEPTSEVLAKKFKIYK